MKKIVKSIAYVLLSFGALGFVLFFYFNEPEPEGKVGAEADAMAMRMLTSLNDSAWKATRYVHWSFRNGNTYMWDKDRNHVTVTIGNRKVLLDANSVTGSVFDGDEPLVGEEADEAVNSAWRSFCNDGFWVYAPYKVFDEGTVRSIVTLADGTEALKVTYMQGGVTPGDSYVWILDESGRTKAWKLWVKIIPLGGVTFTWTDWVQLSTGAWIATDHYSALLNVPITDLQGTR